MLRPGQVTVVELDGPRLTAVAGTATRGGVTVRAWVSAARPEGVAAEDAVALGAWIRGVLDGADIPRVGVVYAVPRSEVVLKRFSVPGAAGLDDGELGSLVRLQMARQLTMPLESAVVDFAPVEERTVIGAGAGDTRERGVVAGAMPGDRVEWCRGLTTTAGLKLARIGVRSFGVAALVAEISQRRGAVMGVALGPASAEFVIVEDGSLALARAADVARPAEAAEFEAYAERLGVEARRTWAGHRAGTAGGPCESVVVLGEGELARLAAARCGAAVEAPGVTLALDGAELSVGVALPGEMSEHDRGAAAPLIGLLVEQARGARSLDFLNPRRAPDRAASRRRALLLAIAGAVVFGGGAWQMGVWELDRLRGELRTLQQQRAETQGRYDAFLIEHARQKHLETWRGAQVDWLAHLERLRRQLPDPREAQLELVSGAMGANVGFVARSSRYPEGAWRAEPRATLTLNGKVARREVGSELRERLVADDVYEVGSRGPDVADRFSLDLQTRVADPTAERGAKPKGEAGNGGSAAADGKGAKP